MVVTSLVSTIKHRTKIYKATNFYPITEYIYLLSWWKTGLGSKISFAFLNKFHPHRSLGSCNFIRIHIIIITYKDRRDSEKRQAIFFYLVKEQYMYAR